jgi:hypothetical protein
VNWQTVETQEDIQQLLQQFGYFHDSCLKELYIWTGAYVNEELGMAISNTLDTCARLLFQRQFKECSAIELYFEEVTTIHISPAKEDYMELIMDATLVKRDNQFYWVADGDWHPDEEMKEQVHWISGKKLKWREVSSWLGEEKRYVMKSLLAE